ncbi:hypothetical protein D3C81_1116530 [compost metagenome]
MFMTHGQVHRESILVFQQGVFLKQIINPRLVHLTFHNPGGERHFLPNRILKDHLVRMLKHISDAAGKVRRTFTGYRLSLI